MSTTIAYKDLYETDFFAWTQMQADFIKKKEFNKIDIVHLEEELESMGASEQRSLESKLTQLIMHLLKLQYQPNYINRKSWVRSVKFQRNDIRRILEKNPSLKSRLDAIVADIYENALLMAAEETALEEADFPSQCEWKVEEILNPLYFPYS